MVGVLAIDWPAFLRSHSIEYAESGKDNIVTHCPLCGADDEGMHLSISLGGRGWRCWRRPQQHKGVSPTRLVQIILGCSWDAARRITNSPIKIPGDFLASVNNLMAPLPEQRRASLKLPDEFLPLDNHKPSRRPFLAYLTGRGFSPAWIDRLSHAYGIYYCSRGAYGGRVIFTVNHEQKLVVWTGRTRYHNKMRYRTLSPNPDKSWKEGYAPAIAPITHYLLWYDGLKTANANTIILSEGPFDALKINILGHNLGIVSTCFFTAEPSDKQIDLLHELLPQFQHKYLMLDRNTAPTALRLSDKLRTLDIALRYLPDGIKDPGELVDAKQLLRAIS